MTSSRKDTSGSGISQDNSHSQKEKSKDRNTNKQHPTGAVQVFTVALFSISLKPFFDNVKNNG